MKDFFNDLKDSETILTVIIALLIGLFIGVFFQTNYSVGIRTVMHDLYIKINPNSQKDSKTLIIDRATKDLPQLPKTNIFEEPQKQNKSVLFYIKKIFIKKSDTQTIFNIDIK